MKTVRMTSQIAEELVEQRSRNGAGRLDECWEGVWHLTDPGMRHQRIAFGLCRVFAEVVEDAARGTAWISINVTDREEGWKENHRCPDGAVILEGNPGRWIGDPEVAFLGGPDLILEVLSQDDETFEKFSFYAERGVRELLVVDQETCRPELWRRVEGTFEKVDGPAVSEVTGLVFSWQEGALEVRDTKTGRHWTIR